MSVPNTHNAIFLGRSYVTLTSQNFLTYEFNTPTPDLLGNLRANGIDTIYVNTADVNTCPSGCTGYADGTYSFGTNISGFLASIRSWENLNPTLPKWTVMAWVNGVTEDRPNLWPKVRLDFGAVRQKIADESLKLTVPSTPGYVGSTASGLDRAFDGVLLDIEPSGINVPTCPEANGDPRRFDCAKLLLQKVRNVQNPNNLSGAPRVGFTPPHFKDTTDSTDPNRWNYTHFYYAGLYADDLVVMAYDTFATSATVFSDYIRTSTKQITKAITGEQWNWDTNHPFPSRVVNVRIGVAAEANTANHNRDIENTSNATIGLTSALNDMSNASATSYYGLPHVKGAAIYLYNTGKACVIDPTGYCDLAGHEYFGYGYDTWANWNLFWVGSYPNWYYWN